MRTVIFPFKSILSRLAIPACGFASIGFLAILYISYPYIYHQAMTAIMGDPFPHPFIDWEFIPSVIRCWTQGVNVYVNIPCFTAIPNSTFDYPPLWLRLTFIRFAEGSTNFFGLSFAVLFFLSLAFLPPPRTARFDFLIRLFSAISSATAFALERANADLIIFLMIMVGVLACGSRRPVRLVGYAVIALAGLLKFYPMVALILAIRERPAIFTAIAVVATTTLGGLLLSYHEEVVWMARNLSFVVHFHFVTLAFGARDLLGGLGVIMSKAATKLFNYDPTSAVAIGRLVYNGLLLLLIVPAVATATWFGRRCRLQSAVAQLDARDADFLLAGAALICGCFFTIENGLYRGIFLLLAVPGLLALADRHPSRLARVALQATCVTIVFVLWFPFVEVCIRFAAAGLGKLVLTTDEGLGRLDRLLRLAMWLCDQLAWWWIVVLLLAVLGAFVLNSEIWNALSRLLPLSRRGVHTEVPRRPGRARARTSAPGL